MCHNCGVNSHAAIPLIACVAYVPLTLLLVANRPWGEKHRLLVAFVGPAFLWSLTDLFARSDYLLDQKWFLSQVVICVAIWAVVQFYYFMRAYFSRTPARLRLAYLFVLAVVSLSALGVVLVFHFVPAV